jgi:hypothetical protein
MSSHVDRLRLQLGRGPLSSRQIAGKLAVSQPTVSRALAALGEEVLRVGAGRAIHYALRDRERGLGDIAVHGVSADGRLGRVGTLMPVRPHGFVIRREDGGAELSHGLPWWLLDMRPQGYLGRAWAARHAAPLGLPSRLNEWSDTHALRALLAHGEDAVGNLLLGDLARERFLSAPAPVPVDVSRYPGLAEAAERGDLPGSSAGGEQPKFVAFNGRHVIVKFTGPGDDPVTNRWRDLLQAEHLAARVLLANGVPAAPSRRLDVGGRRFLEVERFDRVGVAGRRALFSLASLEAEFVGDATASWPRIAARLARAGIIIPAAADGASMLYAFGCLIGNSDMHNGNLSFMREIDGPCTLAPAYDMLPMGFAPRGGASLPDHLPPPRLDPAVSPAIWRQALGLAEAFVDAVSADDGFSPGWAPCRDALARHVADAARMVGRLA